MQDKNNVYGQVVKNGKLIYTQILINASPECVWSEFTNFASYPNWNPFIVSLKGTPKAGNSLEVLLKPPGKKGMVFKPKVLVYDSLKELRWIGKLPIGRLFDGEHVFRVEDNKDGTTTFIQYECFRGILVPFMKQMLNVNTKEGFSKMNEAIKIKCEK
jgi:hypothetical protein